MKSTVTRIQRFISNKNTVTIICIIAGMAVLYFGYNYRVNSSINPIEVPYAKANMEPRHVITADDIAIMKVNSDVVSKATNMVLNASDIVGKEVVYGNSIKAGSFIYQEDITEASLSPDYVLNDIEDGYTAFSMTVSIGDTYGKNVISKGNYIDLWFSGIDDNTSKIMYTNLVERIQVLDVRDDKGVSLSNPNSEGTPAELLFAVPDELYSLLVKAEHIGKLVPIPRNHNYTANPGEKQEVSEYVRSYILQHAASIPENTDAEIESNEDNE